ncbi:Hypothetical Protein CGB_C0070C [Cryptococcus gattii WM276]|uniref:Uncharacterized protein n=2 Tax=Cryptococcus gattii TaxID=37769 RepID=E6R2I7_CRYGW|nr:Hypothetical Protein CGB_C0070C [Cryptococcus gattii WM276]ADV20778.1 Hypothetical Protein CGB_C0070C [Cryptococcus gattii WM276]KIR82399.1 hypothetical protein I306_00511 [Cryptococcus gattii EJB2]
MESEKPPVTLRCKISGRLLILFSILVTFVFTAVLYTSSDYIITPEFFPLLVHPSHEFPSPDPEISQSRHLGGLSGFQVLQNVWVHNGTFYLFAPDRSKLPSKSRAVSGETCWEVFTHPSHELLVSARGAYILEGTSKIGEREVPGGMLSFPSPPSSSLSTTKSKTKTKTRRIKRTTPKLVYILDQSAVADRKLSEQSVVALEAVLGEMEGKGLIDVVHLWVGKSSNESPKGRQGKGEDMKRQIKEIIDADIILSVHGEMLTHQVWMPEGGVVIELFPNESFLPEHQIVADVLSHEYIPVWYDRALSREEWDALPAQYGHGKLYDGTEITVDKVYMRLLLEDVVGRMRSK